MPYLPINKTKRKKPKSKIPSFPKNIFKDKNPDRIIIEMLPTVKRLIKSNVVSFFKKAHMPYNTDVLQDIEADILINLISYIKRSKLRDDVNPSMFNGFVMTSIKHYIQHYVTKHIQHFKVFDHNIEITEPINSSVNLSLVDINESNTIGASPYNSNPEDLLIMSDYVEYVSDTLGRYAPGLQIAFQRQLQFSSTPSAPSHLLKQEVTEILKDINRY